MERSKATLRQWVFATHLELTSLKGVSSMKLHLNIGVTQKTAWFMLHRIREAWGEKREPFVGLWRRTKPTDLTDTRLR